MVLRRTKFVWKRFCSRLLGGDVSYHSVALGRYKCILPRSLLLRSGSFPGVGSEGFKRAVRGPTYAGRLTLNGAVKASAGRLETAVGEPLSRQQFALSGDPSFKDGKQEEQRASR